MKVSDIIQNRKEIFSVRENMSVHEVVQYMVDKSVGAVAVLKEDGCLAGIFSERDILKRVILAEKNPKETPVGEVMTTRLVVITRDAPVEKAMNLMKSAGVRHLPVVEEDKFYGLISIRDVIAKRTEEDRETIQFLTEYMFYVPPES